MKIIQINVVYKKGSTGKIVYDLHSQLTEDGYESAVYFGRGEAVDEEKIKKIAPELVMKLQSLRSRITGYVYAGCVLSTSILINELIKHKPDVVHLHCLNGYFVNIYRLLNFLKENKIPTIITMHAEFMYTAGCSYSLECEKWKTGCGSCPQLNKERPTTWLFDKSAEEWGLMNRAYKNFWNLKIVSVSGWLHNRAKQSPFFKDKDMHVIYNGIDTENIFKPQNYESLKIKHNLKDEKVILYVTPNFHSPIKGGHYALNLAERLKHQNIKMIIVGLDDNQVKLPSNVIPVSRTDNQLELAKYYSLADITILTSKKETFSMICAESLSCGTPIVGFKAGAPETISLSKYSEFVEYGDSQLLEEKVMAWIDRKKVFGERISNDARIKYSRVTMFSKYRELYNRVNV
jgi:glycosyltransferase involved in cell wall biosynthesis